MITNEESKLDLAVTLHCATCDEDGWLPAIPETLWHCDGAPEWWMRLAALRRDELSLRDVEVIHSFV